MTACNSADRLGTGGSVRRGPGDPERLVARGRALAAGIVLGGLAAVATTPPASAGQQPEYRAAGGLLAQVDTAQAFSIPAQPLASALQRFSQQTGISFAYATSQLAGVQSPGVAGTMTPELALETLLAGTGITYRLTGARTATLQPAMSDGNTLNLGPVRVEATQSAVTEGTGSYTTGSMATATGLPLSPRETPQTVSVVPRQRIEDQGLQTLADVLGNAPGITSTQFDSERTEFASRGFPVDNFQYDGITTAYQSSYAAGESEMDMVIYDRVEVVRGATGLLTGAGEPSAAINLVRKRADSKEVTGQASASVGSWENLRAMADVSAPVTEDGRVRARAVMAHEDKESYLDRYERRSSVVYGTVEADVTPATTIGIGSSFQMTDADAVTYGGFPIWYSDGSRTDFGRSFSTAPDWATEETKTFNTFVDFEHRFGAGWNARGTLMYHRNEVENKRLFLWGYPDSATNLTSDERDPSRVQFPGTRTQKSVDLRVSGPFDALGRTHETVFGVSYSDQESEFDRIGATTPWEPISLYDLGSYPEPEWGDPVLSSRNRTKESAAFGAVRLSLTDPLKVIAGARFTNVDREGAGYAGRSPYDYDKNALVPYAGLVYDLTDDLSAYASYTSIFKPQDQRDRNGDWLEPVVGDAYEAGLKGEFFHDRLNASVAVFRIVQDNLAQADGSNLVPGTTSQAYYPASGVTSEGIDIEISGEVAPGWNVFLNAVHYEAEDSDGADVNTYYPRTIARLFTTYRLPGDWQALTIGGGVRWQSQTYYDYEDDDLGTLRHEQSGYAVVDLMTRYEITPETSLQLNVNNVFDTEYYTSVDFYDQAAWGAPRNVLLTLRRTF